MDPTNERKVFDIMVDKLSSDVGHLGKSQYFLWVFLSLSSIFMNHFRLTPKLLKGLKFNEKCTALVVENGAKLSNKITVNLFSKISIFFSEGTWK